MLLIVTVAALWTSLWIHSGCEQRRKVQSLANMGGEVSYRRPPTRVSCWRRGVAQWLGEDFVYDVCTVDFRSEVTPAAIEIVKQFRYVDTLRLHSDCPNSRALEQIALLPNLTSLSIIGCKVSDSGFSHLEDMGNLQRLELCDTMFSDSDMSVFNGLANLVILNISGTCITDAGLRHLNGLANLETLNLAHTEVTDAGLEHLKGLTRLQRLNVEHTKVTDVGVTKLQRILPMCEITR